ncbi:MAG: hypothetical protein ACYCQJ_07960 [Nitrososphaerales archaeon]
MKRATETPRVSERLSFELYECGVFIHDYDLCMTVFLNDLIPHVKEVLQSRSQDVENGSKTVIASF